MFTTQPTILAASPVSPGSYRSLPVLSTIMLLRRVHPKCDTYTSVQVCEHLPGDLVWLLLCQLRKYEPTSTDHAFAYPAFTRFLDIEAHAIDGVDLANAVECRWRYFVIREAKCGRAST